MSFHEKLDALYAAGGLRGLLEPQEPPPNPIAQAMAQGIMPQDATAVPGPRLQANSPAYLSPGPGPHGNVAPGSGAGHRLLQFASEVAPEMALDMAPLIGDVRAASDLAVRSMKKETGPWDLVTLATLLPLVPNIKAAFPKSAIQIAETPLRGKVAVHPEYGMLGKVVEGADVPPVLYHATTNVKGVRRYGALKPMVGEGLGGSPFPGLSFTASRPFAENVERELLRAGQAARGEMDDVTGWLRSLAKEDARAMGIPEATLDRAWTSGAKVMKGKDRAEDAFTGLQRYLSARGDLARSLYDKGDDYNRWIDPLILEDETRNVAEQFRHVRPGNTEIIALPTANLPEESLLTHMFAYDGDEYRLFAEVPVKYEP